MSQELFMAQTDGIRSDNISISSDLAETVIGPKTSFTGNIRSDKPILIQGSFDGEIVSTDFVEIAASGSLKGKVSCRELHLLGKAEGSITCTELLKFEVSGIFKGDAFVKNVQIIPGSTFDGTLTMSDMRK